MPVLHILWDDSSIWGILAAEAAEDMRLPFRLIKGNQIADGLFTRERPSLLLVPGGSARLKAEALGERGIAAVREYIAGGGHYLGFCGGAGLALTPGSGVPGLALCPWRRGRFADRMQHFMSGHLHVSLAEPDGTGASLLPDAHSPSPRLPVWWPGRFEPHDTPDVAVLASYARPADDFWLADLPTADLPPDTFAVWEDLYGLAFSPGYLEGRPCVVSGAYGGGSYVLSYSHLETPGSPDANRWLAHLFRTLGGFSPACDVLPPRGNRPIVPGVDPLAANMAGELNDVLQTGLKLGLLFSRADWLLGWRTGIPGAALNNLRSALRTLTERELAPDARPLWEAHKQALAGAMSLFAKGCTQYLLAERLAMTMSKSLPDSLALNMLKDQRDSLFGPPMQPAGLYRELIEPLDELAFRQLSFAAGRV